MVMLSQLDNLHHLYLHSANSIFFSVENDINSSNENLNLTQWQTIQYSSIDSTGQYLAMAGKHGLIHYSFVTARWKLFGNVQQEQNVTCCGGLVWYKNIIVFACKNEENNKYEIRYYNRDSNLDNSKILFIEYLPEVVYMDILENNLLVYTINNKINHYVLDFDRKNNKLTVTYFSELSIAEFVENPRDVKSLSWYPEVERMHIHHLAKNIEYYWTSMGWDVEVGKLYNSLWLFDGKEIKWFSYTKELLWVMYDEAVRFVDCFQNLEYFGHALELLLHYVLEEEVEKRKDNEGKSDLLPLVIKFIKNYNQYFDIIVQCARKTEVMVWEYFFSIVGDPKILFKIHIEDLIIKQAYILLSQNKIRSLGKIAQFLGFPLKEWLLELREEEEDANKFEIENWNEVFMSLHEQFKWPLPDDILSVKNYIQDYIENVLVIEKENENSNDDLLSPGREGDGRNKFIRKRMNSSNIHIPVTKRSIHNEIDEINFLIRIFKEIKMNDWVLLLSSLSFNIQTIVNTLLDSGSEKQKIYLEKLKEAFITSKGKGYPPLFNAIKDIIDKEEIKRKEKEKAENEE
ncbi:hypothetical protein PIROE2DRAFT_56795 [Piromyces sp. E2]|nr:hypothetical protein PIROE2DRAFT_56795 [Piromyces sp. E2]|eukprot:OUM70500.1 hypothetical protein PIROE2DRAFT_56795 [Piromyces sp. E2]